MGKIIFKTYQFPITSQTFITNQVIAAIEMGYDISIIVSKKNNIELSSQSELMKKYDLLARTSEINEPRPKNRLMVYLKAFKLAAKSYPFKYLKTFNFFKYKKIGLSGRLFYDLVTIYPFKDTDIFHIQFGINAEPLIRLRKYGFLKAKIVITFHGFDVHFTQESFEEKKKKHKDLFTFASYFTCNTQYLAGQLLQLGCPPSKLEIIPMGINITYFKPFPKQEKTKELQLISVGRLIKWKGHNLGIRIIAELIKRGHSVNYTIIGEGEERENLKQLIKKLDIKAKVILTGAKNQQFIRDAMQQADLFLMTSTHDEEGRRETQGVATGEAQACGLPVCAFNSGGVPYTLIDGETGFLSEENDYVGMANNIEKLICNPELRKVMSNNARLFIKNNYSLEVTSKKMQNIYQRLLVINA